MSRRENLIKINHVGFLKKSPKYFVYNGDTHSGEFVVEYLKDTLYTEVFRGKLEYRETEDGTGYTGDFSALDKDGDYRISIDGVKSRHFVIYDKVYDNLARVLLGYFTYQRCGSELGWAGLCHLDDGHIVETGEQVDLSGGYHQSCDLRKSPAGVVQGVLGMARYALSRKPQWGEILITDELKWASDYYLKVIQENGAEYNTLNGPLGWEGREFYESAAPDSAQWCTTSLLALCSIYFKDRDAQRSIKCLETAKRSFEYMTSKKRRQEMYSHPGEFPMGMDPDNFYEPCFPGSGADYGYMAVVSTDMYTATGDKSYLDYVKQGADGLCSMEIYDGIIRIWKDMESSVTSRCNYSWAHGLYDGLCRAIELLPEDKEVVTWKNTLRNFCDTILVFVSKSLWYRKPSFYTDEDLDFRCGHLYVWMTCLPSVREKYEPFSEYNKLNYKFMKNLISPSVDMFYAVILKKAEKILQNDTYGVYAQRVLDNILGCNRLDASHVNAVGYNQAAQCPFGQFFPPTPHIPGAINISFDDSDSTTYSEYDMPGVGMCMYLISVLECSD